MIKIVKHDKDTFICTSCDSTYSKWQGQCPNCHEWNTLVATENPKIHQGSKGSNLQLQPVTDIIHSDRPTTRYSTDWSEYDDLLGGGLVEDSVILLGGEPGIGKSTLLMQLMGSLAKKNKVVYISGEESSDQLALHAQRLHVSSSNLIIGMSQQLEDILHIIQSQKYAIVVVDSIQTLESSQSEHSLGSIAQIRNMTHALIRTAKENHCCLFIIGHITKDGQIAGPKTLEHMVDVVLYFEGNNKHQLRVLRCKKNRFGSSSGIILFDMTEQGLHIVEKADQYFLSDNKQPTVGIATFSTFEGGRSYFVEAQCLTNPSFFPNPKRTALGIDINRLHLILALLDAHVKQSFSEQDVYVSLSGGFRTNDPAADLAIATALLSFKMKIPMPRNILFIGELALSGDVEKTNYPHGRTLYFQKLGYEKLVSHQSHQSVSQQSSKNVIQQISIKHISTLPSILKSL